jgi:hypothetical protein
MVDARAYHSAPYAFLKTHLQTHSQTSVPGDTNMMRTIALCSLLALTACSKVTTENYDKLKTGMSYEDVRSLLGKPDECSDAVVMKSCRWGDVRSHINVNFVADKAVVFTSENLR